MNTYEWTITQQNGTSWAVVVSAQDAERVRAHNWHIVPGKTTTYVAGWLGEGIDRRRHYLHRFLLGLAHGDKREIDHVNGNGLDNRRTNIRIGTSGLNKQNRSLDGNCNNKSGHRGIRWEADRGKWLARCCVDRKEKNLGRFDTIEEALVVLTAYRKEHMPWAPMP